MAAERCGAELLRATAVQVCMTCLDTDSQMFSMSEYELGEAYEHLTGYPLFDVGNLKHTLCIECTQRLTNFVHFRDKSLRARALMMDFVKQHKVITLRHVAALRPLQAALELERSADAQTSVNTEPDLDRAWDSADVEASAKMEPYMIIAWDSAEADSVKIEPDVIIEFDGADVQASGSADAEASVKMEPDLDLAWDSADAKTPAKALGSAELRDAKLLAECRVLLTRMSRVEERALATRRTARARGGCSASVAVVAARLATGDENNSRLDRSERDETIDKCEQVFDIHDDEVDNKSGHYNNDTRGERCINTPHDIVSTITRDAMRKPKKRAPEQDEARTVTRKHYCYSDSDTHNDAASKGCDDQTTSQDELHTSETIDPLATHTTEENDCLNNDTDVGNIVRTFPGKHIEETSYICDVCQRRFNRKKCLAKYIISHTEEKPFSCKLCQYKCKYNSNLLQQMRTHTGETPYTCKLCNYKSTKNSDLVQHMRTHSVEKPFICKLCNYKSTKNSHLVRHMKTHTGEKPFTCKLCNYKTTRNSDLVRHMRTHTGKKPFTCKLCNYKTTRNSDLVRHMRTHTGKKPFTCKLCNYKTTRNSDLVRHMRTHTGEKPFACELCGYKCSRNRGLVSHMRTHSF